MYIFSIKNNHPYFTLQTVFYNNPTQTIPTASFLIYQNSNTKAFWIVSFLLLILPLYIQKPLNALRNHYLQSNQRNNSNQWHLLPPPLAGHSSYLYYYEKWISHNALDPEQTYHLVVFLQELVVFLQRYFFLSDKFFFFPFKTFSQLNIMTTFLKMLKCKISYLIISLTVI